MQNGNVKQANSGGAARWRPGAGRWMMFGFGSGEKVALMGGPGFAVCESPPRAHLNVSLGVIELLCPEHSNRQLALFDSVYGHFVGPSAALSTLFRTYLHWGKEASPVRGRPSARCGNDIFDRPRMPSINNTRRKQSGVREPLSSGTGSSCMFGMDSGSLLCGYVIEG
jgi:hypothetical protein